MHIPNPDFEFPLFKNDRARIKFISEKFKTSSIRNAFEEYYGIKINTDNYADCVKVLGINDISTAKFVKAGKSFIELQSKDIKEQILTREKLTDYCGFDEYLLKYGNELPFKVLESKDGVIYVSVMQALYEQWNKEIQQLSVKRAAIEVYDLVLTKGGFTGKTHIQHLCEFVGENTYLDVFVPGSQIELNIAKDFDKWVGQSIWATPSNFVEKNGKTCLVVSRKKFLQTTGNYFLINLFMKQNDEGAFDTIYNGKVTGIINSPKNSGVFIELEDQNVTGLIHVKPNLLSTYKPGQMVQVRAVSVVVPPGKTPVEFVPNLDTRVVDKVNIRVNFEEVIEEQN